jgi:integrase
MARKRQQRRSWGAIRQLANKSRRWQASYVGPDLVRHVAPATFTHKMDAEVWLASERRLVETGAWSPPSVRQNTKALTLAAYAQTWLADRNVKPRTKAGYQAMLDQHIVPKLGALPLTSLTPHLVRSWYASLGKDTPTRNSHVYSLLHAVLATAVSDELIATNPCTISGAMNVPTRRQSVILTPAEVSALADAMPERYRALVLLAAWCGPRWGEVIELRRRDLSDDHAVLTIARGVTHRQGQCNVDTPKSGKGRKVVLPPHIRPIVAQHLEQHVAKGADAQLFPAARACHLNDKVFRDHFTKALATIGREGVRFHDLRHFCGTQTARVGNLVETMDRLGHSTVKASLIYQQMVSGRDAAVAEALSKLADDDA